MGICDFGERSGAGLSPDGGNPLMAASRLDDDEKAAISIVYTIYFDLGSNPIAERREVT